MAEIQGRQGRRHHHRRAAGDFLAGGIKRHRHVAGHRRRVSLFLAGGVVGVGGGPGLRLVLRHPADHPAGRPAGHLGVGPPPPKHSAVVEG